MPITLQNNAIASVRCTSCLDDNLFLKLPGSNAEDMGVK